MCSKLATILMLVAFPGLCLGQALSPKEIFNSASKSIVVIVTGDANGKPLMQGSGVAFGGGLVLTNCHVLEDAYSVAVETQGKAYAASRLRNDKGRDLCSLTVAGLPSPKVRIGSVSNLSIGDKVYAIGAPRGLELTFTDGLVSSIRTGQILQTTAAISPGSSGGGLFDEYGQLVGITTLTLKDSQGLNFAVPVEWATALASNQSGISAMQDRSEVEIEVVRKQLNKYEEELRATDPYYEQLKPQLYAITSEIVKKYPRSQWLAMVKLAYASIREEWDSADVTAAQADAAAAAAEAAADNGPFEITAASIGRAVDANNMIVSPSASFGAADTIHASVSTDGAGGLLTATWSYEDGQTVDVQDKEVAAGPQTTDFSVRKPDGWPAGAYRLQVAINGKPVRAIGFSVVDNVRAGDDRWLLVYEDSERQDHIDVYTARHSGNAVVVWMRSTYSQPTTMGGYKGIAKAMQRWRYDCSARTSQILNVTAYSKAGEIIAEVNDPRPSEQVLPESVGEVVLNKVCSKRTEFDSD